MIASRSSAFVLLLLSLPAVACSDDSGSSGSSGSNAEAKALSFHFEQEALPGFSFSTGLQPAGSPVQLGLTVSASGKSDVDAEGYAVNGGGLVARKGSGEVSISGGFQLVGQLKVDITGLTYDGDIPGLKDVKIPFEGKTPFEPFSIGKEVSASAPVPPTDLPPIPLPGGLPGTLNLKIGMGSTVDVGFTGVCAGVDGGKASYHGTLRRGGTVTIEPKVVIKIPLKGEKEFPLPPVTLPINGVAAPIDLGSPAATAGKAPADAGEASATSCTGASGQGGSGGQGGGSQGGSAGSAQAGSAGSAQAGSSQAGSSQAGSAGSAQAGSGQGGSAGAAGSAAGSAGSAGSGGCATDNECPGGSCVGGQCVQGAPVCDSGFLLPIKACGQCLSDNCCNVFKSCSTDQACSECVTGKGASGCEDNVPLASAVQVCIKKTCASQCETPCNACLKGACPTELDKFNSNPDAQALATCIGGCAIGDSACEQSCNEAHPQGVGDLQALQTCASGSCASQCSAQ